MAVFVLIGVNCKSASLHEPLFQPKSPYVRLIRLKVFTVSKSVIRNEAFSEQITFERVKVRSLSQVTGVYLSESAIREFTWINKELGSIFSISLGSVRVGHRTKPFKKGLYSYSY